MRRFVALAVFCGPSLPPHDRGIFPGVTYLPPASRGDVARAAERFDALLLLDGVFHHDLAPSPKEVYAASQRIALFGAASMGALRVAECAPYGAVPLGIIARWYINAIINGDDEVAVLTHPQTHAALSVPCVNVRYVAWLAKRRGFLSARQAERLVYDARRIFYMERTWKDVIACVPSQAQAHLANICAREGDLKRHDARFALRSVLRRMRGDAGGAC
ncbi:MAG: TfuA-like protein [Vulcanimicrobiaceae bacterium]